MADMTIFAVLRNAARSKALHPVSEWKRGWRVISEPFTGAWQRNESETVGDLTCYPTLYACLSSIAQDIAKLPFVLVDKTDDGIFKEIKESPYLTVLREPNGYQNPQQFRESWVLSLLTNGNTYVLKGRDARGVVNRLYVLDPCRVTPMVSDTGSVFYQIHYPSAQNLLPAAYPAEQLIIPAREMIHARINCLYHPLIGIPPLCAVELAAGKNLKILRSSSMFFQNSAQPGGLLTAPAGMSETDAKDVKNYWDTEYGGDNAGKIAVIGADMKFTSFAMKGADAQVIEHLKYSDEQICQPFRIKPYKIGIGSPPGGWKSDDVNVEYHGDALSPIIESMEDLLADGLGVRPYQIWLDDETLWRMDAGKLAEVETKLVGGMIKTPDESRRKMNLPKTGGGDTLWGQHQDYPLGMLRNRDDLNPVVAPITEEESSGDEELEAANEEVRRLTAELWQRKALEATREAINA